MASGTILRYEGKRGVRWRIRLDYKDPSTGKRCQPWETLDANSTERDAKRRLKAWLAEVEKGHLPATGKMTLGELLIEWLDREARFKVAPTTLEGYEEIVRLHLIPELGKLLAKRLTAERVLQFRSAKLDAGTGRRTMQLAIVRLRQALDYAVRMEYLPRNVATGVGSVSHTAAERKAWNSKQARQFLKAASAHVYHPIWHVALAAGLRRGELLGLRWCDVDLVAGTLMVRQSVVRLAHKPYIKTPKTASSTRRLALDADTCALLAAHRVRQVERRLKLSAAWEDHDLIFASARGTPISPDNMSREMRRLVARAKVPALGVHGMRHTAVVLMQEAGLPLKVMSERLGHKSIRMTADIYAHLSETMQSDAARLIGDVLRGEDSGEIGAPDAEIL